MWQLILVFPVVTLETKQHKKITISGILQFRRALNIMQKPYPFSLAFGDAHTREACIESASQVYDRLLLRTPEKATLEFETIALLAKEMDGSIYDEKINQLIKVFRPGRDGKLTKLEFVKSIDEVYKELRLISAKCVNSMDIDANFEGIINIFFYFLVGCAILWALGFDPLALFFSLSSIILAFAFMFSSASAKYFEGLLFVFVQNPYGVGDRIHISRVDSETNRNGSAGWIVDKVTLFTTTVYWGITNEKATISNAAIAQSRVINAARSPNARIEISLKFGIDISYEKIKIFKTAVEEFLKARPREWLMLVGFRAIDVFVDRGYIEYKVIAMHRDSWQTVASIQESRATLTSYCLEVSKQLDMRYRSPPLPVDLKVANAITGTDDDNKEAEQLNFQQMAMAHGIKID